MRRTIPGGTNRNSAAGGTFALCLFGLIALPFDLTPSMESSLQFEMIVRRMESLLPILQSCLPIVVLYWFVVLLPMFVFPRMRRVISSMLTLSSLLVGLVCWWQAFIVTYRLLGGTVLIVGTLCGIIGVVPTALYATATRNDGATFVEIAVTLVLAVAARSMAKAISNRASRLKSVRVVHYDDYNKWTC